MNFVRNIQEAQEVLNEEINKLQKKADTVIQPMQQYEKYPDVKEYQWSAFHVSGGFKHGIDLMDKYFLHSSNYGSLDNITQETLDKGLQHFQSTYDQWKKDASPIVEHNNQVSDHNKLQEQRIRNLMSTLGVRDHYSTWEYKTSRSRNKTETKNRAGYLNDLDRIAPKDNYSILCKKIDDKYDAIKRLGEDALKKADQLRREKEQEKREEDKQHTLSFLRIKYLDDPHGDISEVINAILAKDKYLMLAYWLEENRGDWSEGYNYAQTGLDSFIVETDIDQKIEAELAGIINEAEDIDGRVFRDCEWNYSVLYGMVEDDTLSRDLEMAKGLTS